VTITPETGATASMALNFNPATNITIDGLTITDSEMAGAGTKNITVRNSAFDQAQAVFRTGSLQNANIVFDHNTHNGFVKCSSCGEGRLWLPESTSQPAGITIESSYFSGGNSDGIQNGGNGVRILNNTFADIFQHDGPDGVHADAIQLYGSRETVIRGNRMRDVATGIMAPDGTDHEVIEDNVIKTDGYPYAITLGGDRGSIVRDNRLPGGRCHYELPCGTLRISANKDGVGSSGTVVEGNTLGALAVDGASHLAAARRNAIGG
jgi:nitrous oxidase accessory protein NosD